MAEQTKNKLWTGEEIVSADFDEVPQVVEGIIEAGTLMLFAGAPKAGKSFLSLDLALSVAGGYDFLTDHATEKGQVLYLALEDTPRRINRRMVQMLFDSDHDALRNLTVITDCPRENEGGKQVIHDWIKSPQVPNPQLIIVDTLFRFRDSRTLGGGYRNDAMSVLWLHKLAQKGIAIMVVHHDIKAKTQSWEKAIAGSTGLTGVVDGMMMLKKYREEGQTKGFFFSTSRDLDEIRLKLHRDPASAKWVKSDDQSGVDNEEDMTFVALPPSVQKIQELFILNPTLLFRTNEIVTETGLTESIVTKGLSKLKRMDFIEKVSKGMYRLAKSKIEG